MKNKTINIHTGIRIVKYLNSVQLILRMEIVQNNGSGLFFYLEKYGRLFNRLSRGRLMKLMAIILPRSGRIKGRTPTASALSNGIPARKWRLRIPPTKTSESPKRLARKMRM